MSLRNYVLLCQLCQLCYLYHMKLTKSMLLERNISDWSLVNYHCFYFLNYSIL